MRVAEVMSRAVVTLAPGDTLIDAQALMRRTGTTHVPVMRAGRLVGLLSALEVDAARPSAMTSLTFGEVASAMARLRVAAVMAQDVLTVTPETPLVEAVRLMRDWRVRALPVVRGREVVGMLSDTMLFNVFAAQAGPPRTP